MANAQAQQRLLEVEASAMGKALRRAGRGPAQKTQENLQIFLLKINGFKVTHLYIHIFLLYKYIYIFLIHLIDLKFAYWH